MTKDLNIEDELTCSCRICLKPIAEQGAADQFSDSQDAPKGFKAKVSAWFKNNWYNIPSALLIGLFVTNYFFHFEWFEKPFKEDTYRCASPER